MCVNFQISDKKNSETFYKALDISRVLAAETLWEVLYLEGRAKDNHMILPCSIDHEVRSLRLFKKLLLSQLAEYETSIEEDTGLLNLEKNEILKNIIALRRLEKKVYILLRIR